MFVKTVAVVLVMALCSLMALPSGWAQERSDEDRENTGTQYGLGVAAVFTSLPYSISKFAFATMGAIFGGFTYVFSAGNEKAAQAVWDTSMRGTYVISPRHLKGEEPIRFFGVPPVRDEAAPAPSAPEPAPVAPTPAP
jgi:hypothetical protein